MTIRKAKTMRVCTYGTCRSRYGTCTDKQCLSTNGWGIMIAQL